MALKIDIPAGYTVVAGKKQLRATLRQAGAEVAAKARAMIRAAGRKGVSLPGQPPVSRTGLLARSFKVRLWKDGEGVTVRNTAFYSLFLEKGAKGGVGSGRKGMKGQRNKRGAVVGSRILQPRPVMEPALDAVVSNGLADRVREAVVSGMAFRRGT